jgi:hypothetical protein
MSKETTAMQKLIDYMSTKVQITTNESRKHKSRN